MLNRFVIFILICLSPLAFGHEPEEGSIYATLGPFLYKTNYEGKIPGVHSPFLGGFGLLVEGDVDRNGGLELGAFYQHKLYFRSQEGMVLAEKTKVLNVTMGYRHWFDHRLSVGAAFYSSYTIGDPRVIHNDFPPGRFIDTSARDTTEYGFDLSFLWEFARIEEFALVMDTRYSIAITPKYHEKEDHYGVLFAVKRLVQEKGQKPFR